MGFTNMWTMGRWRNRALALACGVALAVPAVGLAGPFGGGGLGGNLGDGDGLGLGGPLDDGNDLGEPEYDADSCYFGDMHAHTAFSPDAFIGQTAFYHGPLREYGEERRDPTWAYDYALNETRLDFVAINDHAESQPEPQWVYPMGYEPYSRWELPSLWDLTLEQSRDYPDSCEATGGVEPCLVIFPGWEYTGEETGHKNVVWKSLEHVPDSTHPAFDNQGEWVWTDLLTGGIDEFLGEVPEDSSPEELWAWCEDWVTTLQDADPESADQVDFLTIVHTPGEAPTHDTEWDHTSEEHLRLVEVYSKHGNSMGGGDSYEAVPDQDGSKTYLTTLGDWSDSDTNEFALGVVAGTDTHAAKPGNDSIDPDNVEWLGRQMFYGGGVAGVVADSKDRDDLWDALEARRTFGTTGPRIRILLHAESDTRRVWQGEMIDPGDETEWELTVSVRADEHPVTGDQERIDRIEIWRDGDAYDPECEINTLPRTSIETTCDITLDEDTRASMMAVAIMTSGERAWTSPIFFDGR